MNCKKCGDPTQDATELCGPCTFKLGEGMNRKFTKDELRLLRIMVNEETAGLMSMEILKAHLREMHERVNRGEDYDGVVDETALRIQILAGTGMCREMLKVTQALQNMALEQEEEIRSKIRKLTDLGEKP